MLEGSVDFVSNPSPSTEEAAAVRAGADLVETLVSEMITASDAGPAFGLFERGREDQGNMIALGRHLARQVVHRDGPQALASLLEEGCLAFLQRALEIESEGGRGLFEDDLTSAIDELSAKLHR